MDGKYYGIYMNHPNNKMMNGQNKTREIYKPTKREGPSTQGILENKMEILESENHSLYPLICSLYFVLTAEFTRLK